MYKHLVLLLIFLSLSIDSLYARVSFQDMQKVFKTFHEIYDDELADNEVIEFNRPSGAELTWWDIDLFKATYHGYSDDFTSKYHHLVFIFGGIPLAEFMTVDGLALVICHELGHGFAGAPFKEEGASVEGQADYYATGECLTKFFKKYPLTNLDIDSLSDKTRTLCRNDQVCLRKMLAIQTRIEIFKIRGNTSSLDSFETEEASEINFSDNYYPTSQCRVDTFKAAALKKKRPACWFRSNY
jgi:hypothetical protein